MHLIKPGDIFVKKSPSSTVGEIANALKKIYSSNVKIIILVLDMERRSMRLYYQEKN